MTDVNHSNVAQT